MSDSVSRAALALVSPRPAYRTSLGGGPVQSGVGTNPPNGAILSYFLAKAPDSTAALTLDILDARDAVIRRFSSAAPPKDARPDALREPKLPASAGLNRFVWDLRRAPVAGVPGTLSGQSPGYRVTPGTYRVRLALGPTTDTKPLSVLPDPREETSAVAFDGQQEFLARVYARIDEIHGMARRLRAARDQIQGVLDRTRDTPAADTIAKSGKALTARIDSLEGQLVNVRNKTFQDVVNYPPGIEAQYAALAQVVDGSDAPVTGGAKARFTDLEAAWVPLQQTGGTILGGALAGFNALVREKGVPAVIP
jgi:hypothetical protein